MTFPRVLVIAPVKFNQETGSGVTMGNLFRGWPIEALAQIHSDRFSRADETICRQYYELPYYRVRRETPMRMAFELVRQTGTYLAKRQESLAGHFAHLDSILNWSKQFAPDLIYARPINRPSFYIWLPYQLSQALDVPYVTRILDDWPARYDDDPVWPRRLFWRFYLRRNLQRLFDHAAANLAISEEMCTAYQHRYGREFVAFNNCIEVSEWQSIEKNYALGSEFHIVYLGTVTPDKELDSLIDLREVILQLRQEGYPVQLTVYGPPIYRRTVRQHLERPPTIVHGGYFPLEEKARILSQADLLVLPINFSAVSQVYVGYSFQTKLPEYMASGTPVLLYGPPANPNVRYATRQRWGLVVDRPDKAQLSKAILACYQDQALRETLGRRAKTIALRDHNAVAVRQRFLQLIRSVADQKGVQG
jgi:glycosyltransferase involved in cell wall biosynthesis